MLLLAALVVFGLLGALPGDSEGFLEISGRLLAVGASEGDGFDDDAAPWVPR
jgi:hypothetical protein